jgi:hypothetical protein
MIVSDMYGIRNTITPLSLIIIIMIATLLESFWPVYGV